MTQNKHDNRCMGIRQNGLYKEIINTKEAKPQRLLDQYKF
jgi:hypothetical protein